MRQKRFLVIGGDSLIGGRLLEVLRQQGHDAIGTTRRSGPNRFRHIYLDVVTAMAQDLPADIDHVFLVAAVTGYQRCETEAAAQTTNVEAIPRLARYFFERGTYVTFLSTNAVFDSHQAWPAEEDQQAPASAYARQKSLGEARIGDAAAELGAIDRYNIVRLTKVIDATVSPFRDWLTSLGRNQPIQPFSDLIFAPVSLEYAAQSLAQICTYWTSGSLHLSGAESLSYASFARRLAAAMDKATALVQETTSTEMGVTLSVKQSCGGLSMERTRRSIGLTPQAVDDVIGYLLKQPAA